MALCAFDRSRAALVDRRRTVPILHAMCVLAIWLGLDPHTPLVVAANRDESYARPSAAPAEIEPGIIAGRDLEKGGTWLGLNRNGPFIAVTNRRSPPRTPTSFSRGQLALATLRCRTLASVEAMVGRRVSEHQLGGFNLVAILKGEGLCLHYDGALRRATFSPGVHVVSSDLDLDDPQMPEKLALDRFIAAHAGIPDEASLRTFLASHEGERPVCKHGNGYGTVSSIILTVADTGTRLLYADGPPCRRPFVVQAG